MAKMGWIKLYRDIQNNDIWKDKPYARGQAWIDLLLMANHQDKKMMYDGAFLDVKQGEIVTSIRKLSDSWMWSPTKVKRLLEQLESDNMITFKCDTKKTVLTLINYEKYQSRDFEKSHQKDTEKSQKNIKSDTEKYQKNIKKIQTRMIKNIKNEKNNIRACARDENSDANDFDGLTDEERIAMLKV